MRVAIRTKLEISIVVQNSGLKCQNTFGFVKNYPKAVEESRNLVIVILNKGLSSSLHLHACLQYLGQRLSKGFPASLPFDTIRLKSYVGFHLLG